MAERARITSVDALEEFHSALVIYLDKARRVIDEVSDEVKHTRTWLESDRMTHWKGEVKRRRRLLEMREQELFSARLGTLGEPTQMHRQAVQKARRAVQEAEEKVDRIRRWTREFENRVTPYTRHMEQMRQTFTVDMKKAVASLNQSLDTLRAYADVAKTRPSPPLREDDGDPVP